MAAENARESIGNMKVKIDVDVSEALTGLKAVQREAKKATQALAEFEATNYQPEYDKYERIIKELSKGETPSSKDYQQRLKLTNRLIYDAYTSYSDIETIELFFPRCSGVSTSIRALTAIFDEVIYVNLHSHTAVADIADKVVFIESGLPIPRGSRTKRVIRIRSIDVTGKGDFHGRPYEIANVN